MLSAHPGLMTQAEWQAAAQEWLQKEMDAHFKAWLQTKEGRKWKTSRQKESPYHCGYSQPEWADNARTALGKNDEETFKAIKMVEMMYLWKPEKR